MKKITSIATALCMATAFCGFCFGCASDIDSQVSENANAVTPIVSADGEASSQPHVILSPGYQQGYGSTANTIATGAEKLTPTQEDMYWVSNAYFATVAAGEDLPTPTTTRAKTTFDGWTYAKDGVVVTVEKMPASLTEDLYLYARWKTEGSGGGPVDPDDPDDPTPDQTTGLIVNGTTHSLIRNTGNTTTTEYWLGEGVTVNLTKGNTVTLKLNGKAISAFIDPSSIGADKSVTDTALSSFTITTTGAFRVYLRANTDGTYTVEFTGPSDIGEETNLPQGTPSTLTFSDGTKITLYLKKDGKDITNLGAYKIWMWDGSGDFFTGGWVSRPTFKSNMTLSKPFSTSVGLKFTWGDSDSQQSGNFNGFEAGATYLITLESQGGTISKVKV